MIINPITLIIGLTFSPIAAIMAFLITYNEYRRHYSTETKPRKMALEVAIVTFVFFLALSVVIGWLLKGIIK